MSKIVYIDHSGIRVAKPGFDASTAAESNLIFDTRSYKYFSILLQGSVPFSAFSQTSYFHTSSETYTTWRYVVDFGVTLPAAPIVFMTTQDPIQTDGTCVTLPYDNDEVTYYYTSTFDYATGGAFTTGFVADESSLTINIAQTILTYTPPIPAFWNYTVMRTS